MRFSHNVIVGRHPTTWRRWSATLLVILLSGCASSSHFTQEIPPFRGEETPNVPDFDVLALSPEMIEFLERHVPKRGTRGERAWALSHLAVDRYMMAFDYSPELTLTAGEAFARREGNCLTFSNLLIAMARHMGLRARYQQVHIRPDWNNRGNTLLLSMHVNVSIAAPQGEYVVDISGQKRAEFDLVSPMSDLEARAQYFNNLGVDGLLREDLPQAYANFHRALSIDNDKSYLWSNLGVVLSRNLQTEDAIWAYQVAMQKDRYNSTASNNLFAIYERIGNLDAADDLRRKVERHQRKNPYHLMVQSQTALVEQRYEDSIQLLKRAIKLKDMEYRLHAQLAISYYLVGDHQAAEASYAQALALVPAGVELEFTLEEVESVLLRMRAEAADS